MLEWCEERERELVGLSVTGQTGLFNLIHYYDVYSIGLDFLSPVKELNPFIAHLCTRLFASFFNTVMVNVVKLDALRLLKPKFLD